MQEFKIEINNKQYTCYLNDNDFSEIIKKLNSKTGYERAKEFDCYFTSCCGVLAHYRDCTENFSNDAYKCGNYYTNKQVAENNIRADTLMRNLRRFAAEHGGMLPMNMEHKIPNYQIACKSDGTLYADTYVMNQNLLGFFGEIWFASKEAAEQAIETFHDELIWYFTEYNPMPEGWQYKL